MRGRPPLPFRKAASEESDHEDATIEIASAPVAKMPARVSHRAGGSFM
jgi:hypothetical protein